jgi:hypothetical protein
MKVWKLNYGLRFEGWIVQFDVITSWTIEHIGNESVKSPHECEDV